MKVILNEDRNIVENIREALRNNEGYCPCALIKSDDTECMCRGFREQETPGYCHCRLYKKVEEL